MVWDPQQLEARMDQSESEPADALVLISDKEEHTESGNMIDMMKDVVNQPANSQPSQGHSDPLLSLLDSLGP